jgi:hypothetical protein
MTSRHFFSDITNLVEVINSAEVKDGAVYFHLYGLHRGGLRRITDPSHLTDVADRSKITIDRNDYDKASAEDCRWVSQSRILIFFRS